jgi:PAS domain S-box-containing protein
VGTVLALVGVATLVAASAVGLRALAGRSQGAGEASFPVLGAALATAAFCWREGRREGRWVGSWWAAAGAAVLAGCVAAGALANVRVGDAGTGFLVGGAGAWLVALLVAGVGDFRAHVQTGRIEIFSDVALVSAVSGAGVYLLLRATVGTLGHGPEFALAVAVVIVAVVVFATWAMLALWRPTRVHFALMAFATLAAWAAVSLAGSATPGPLAPIALAISMLGVAAVIALDQRLVDDRVRARSALWIRPGLLILSLMAICLMFVFAVSEPEVRITEPESVTLAILVFASVTLRTLLSHVEIGRSAGQREAALAEREEAIASMRAAADVAGSSEARMRLLLDSAVDGIVELDGDGMIIRANEAFCEMVRLEGQEVEGRRWDELAQSVRGGESLTSLPETGEAVIMADDVSTYLEARASPLPTSPPGTLMLIRDVTASKVSEQTIRTLFQFLQDRDEDRTRLLQRINSAIEAERNRISRDIHDGPVQGMAAATLSVQAARMMVESGRIDGAVEMLRQIAEEMEDETGNLRRLMSALRPPVLDERGLIPAVHELCGRFERDSGIAVTVEAKAVRHIPNEVETLAYRVVQEALTNVGKHAGASAASVRIEAGGGILRVEISDDGKGFEPGQAREFLRRGKVGLASMRERAELAGGTLIITSSIGQGTTVMASLPFEILASVPRMS